MHFRDTSDDGSFNLQLTNPADSITSGDVPDSGVNAVADGPPAPAGSTVTAGGTTIVPVAGSTTTSPTAPGSVWSTLTSAFTTANSIFGQRAAVTPTAGSGSSVLLPLLLVGGAIAAVVVMTGKKK